jgi:hypothetical protein
MPARHVGKDYRLADVGAEFGEEGAGIVFGRQIGGQQAGRGNGRGGRQLGQRDAHGEGARQRVERGRGEGAQGVQPGLPSKPMSGAMYLPGAYS